MKRIWTLWLLAVALGGPLACPGPSAPVQVEVLDFDPEAGEWRLATSTLDTVTDLDRLTGEWFDLLGNQQLTLDMNALQSLAPERADAATLREMVLDRPGDPVQLSYDWVNDASGDRVAVANDFESLAMMTTFHHFEKVWAFARDVVGDQSDATRAPTMIGFYATLAARIGISIPVLSSDNAAFLPLSDSFLIFRSQLIDGIPFALNSGVIAHEFSHRVFFHNAFSTSARSNWYRDSIVGETSSEAEKKTFVLLKGIDEGCADITAIAYTGRTDFIADSILGDLGASTRVQRDVEGPFADWADYDRLQWESWSDDAGNDVCSGISNGYTETTWNFYCIGTVWARALWDASGRDQATLREVLMPALNRAIKRLGDEHLARAWEFDVYMLLELVVQETPTSHRGALCSAFDDKFAGQMSWVASCP